ncbi:uncharacterized protein LOC120713333 [Panicum virgatum]|uniref:uncharacterized protein LOC120713333 n=1 Tax=Panicum virgatum TaxID=38727 RepID=UPI0019D5B1E2|nr:uncharacterized protein LOC120713333 [Panicum virgatum]
MAGGHERRTMRIFDSGGANQDRSGSSRPNVVSGREMRPRERMRAVVADIVEESDGGSSSDDDVEDELYRVEQRHGKAPAQESSSEEEADGDDEEEEENEGREENLTYPII